MNSSEAQRAAFSKNERFLRNIYEKGPFQGHAFIADPPRVGIKGSEGGDYTLRLDKTPAECAERIVKNYERECRFHEEVGDDSVPLASLHTGTHLFSLAFGCEVHQPENDNPFALPAVEEAEEADKLPEPSWEDCPGLMRVFEVGSVVRDRLGKDVWLAPPDLQTAFDVLCLVWEKASLYCALIDEEEKEIVHNLLQKIQKVVISFLTALRKEFPTMVSCHCPEVWTPPEKGFWFSNDEIGAISNENYLEFVDPIMREYSQVFDGVGMHCCADAEHQFQYLARTPDFYGFNRVSAKHGYTPILEYFGGPDAPVHALAWVSEEQIQELVAKAPDGTRFIFNLKQSALEDAKAWLERMRALSPRTD